jgi:hypothetical protein
MATRGPVEAAILGTTRLPSSAQEGLVSPDAAPLRAVPQDVAIELGLSRVEDFLGRGHFGAALREAGTLKFGAALASRYEFIREEKISRARLGIAHRYALRGDRDSARRFFERAVAPETMSLDTCSPSRTPAS